MFWDKILVALLISLFQRVSNSELKFSTRKRETNSIQFVARQWKLILNWLVTRRILNSSGVDFKRARRMCVFGIRFQWRSEWICIWIQSRLENRRHSYVRWQKICRISIVGSFPWRGMLIRINWNLPICHNSQWHIQTHSYAHLTLAQAHRIMKRFRLTAG